MLGSGKFFSVHSENISMDAFYTKTYARWFKIIFHYHSTMCQVKQAKIDCVTWSLVCSVRQQTKSGGNIKIASLLFPVIVGCW